MKTVLITGSEGFVGGYLLTALKEDLYKIVPTSHPRLIPKIGEYIPLDILSFEMTREIIREYKPDIIFHLAAISSVSRSFREPPVTYDTNIMGTVNLLESARSLNSKVRFIYVSTCEVYGGGRNLSEDAPIVLKNPYAVSKYAAELVCQNYGQFGIDWMILRPFTHTGPGQADNFVLSSIARQIAEMEKDKKPPLIELGNIKAEREFMNVRDIVYGYRLALKKCRVKKIYNISSNKGYTIEKVLRIFKKIARKKFEIKVSAERVRKVDIPYLIGNGRRFSRATGWKPGVTIEKTVEDLLNYWRAKI